jgi:hypothetical protein
MSSLYRTTVISGKNQLEEVWESENLSSASFVADCFGEEGDQIKIDEVLKDACGDYIILCEVMGYVKVDD